MTTFQETEDKLFDKQFPYINMVLYSAINIKSFLHESHKRYAEWLVGEINKDSKVVNETLDSSRLNEYAEGYNYANSQAISIIKSSLN